MSEDTAMNEAELRQAVESMRAQIAALSGRIDGLDRGEILRGVNDGRRDKLAERHAQAFGRHSGDGVAHHYRDYVNPHKIPGMQEVRVFEDAAGTGIEYICVEMVSASDISAGTIPYDTVRRNTSASTFEYSAASFSVKVLEAGDYEIHASCKINAPFYDSDGDMASVPEMRIRVNGNTIAWAQAEELRPGTPSSHNSWSPWLVAFYAGLLSVNDIITITTTETTSKGGSTPMFLVKKIR